MLCCAYCGVECCAACCADGVVLIVLLQAAAGLVSNRQLQYSNSNKNTAGKQFEDALAIIQHTCEVLRRSRYTAAAAANLLKC